MSAKNSGSMTTFDAQTGLTKELAVLHLSDIVELQRDVLENSGHTGTGSVIQLIVTKD